MNQPVASLSWRHARLADLSPVELARIYRARQLVFSIEQNCVYLDADEADERSHHLAAWSSAHELPLAYARLVEPGVKYAEPSMGRVITTEAARGTGLGRELVKRVLVLSSALYPGLGVRISAQSRLRRFYGEVGFEAVGEDYMEDGIPHIEMLRPG
ncbi:MAG TPA: GNAT family N-acetyltransferase [Rhizobacter sp.]|nr:GNAT family N-acetyltransferase [Rhizobacter sp.]